MVEDIASGRQHQVTGDNALQDHGTEGGPSALYEIGSQWAEGAIGTNVGGAVFFLNWHTGQLVWEEEDGSEHNVENLSNEHLRQRICRPITRPENTGDFRSSVYSLLEYEPPFAAINAEDEVSSQLRRCGSGKRDLLTGGGLQLGSRVLSWVGRGAYVIRLYAKGRRWHGPYYRLGGLPKQMRGAVLFVEHTSTTVFATSNSTLGSARVYTARLPWLAKQKRG